MLPLPVKKKLTSRSDCRECLPTSPLPRSTNHTITEANLNPEVATRKRHNQVRDSGPKEGGGELFAFRNPRHNQEPIYPIVPQRRQLFRRLSHLHNPRHSPTRYPRDSERNNQDSPNTILHLPTTYCPASGRADSEAQGALQISPGLPPRPRPRRARHIRRRCLPSSRRHPRRSRRKDPD